MGSVTVGSDSLVDEIQIQLAVSEVCTNTWNSYRILGDHPQSLNTNWWPIVKQYCEGKVKRTPDGEWNRTWNPVFPSTQRALKLDVVLFVERSGELTYVARLSTSGVEPQGNRVWIGRVVAWLRPETGWPTHDQDEVEVKLDGGPNRPPLKCWRMNCG